jgi:hypothetical protein
MNPAVSLMTAMRAALLVDGQLATLLGGPHVHDEPPHGEQAPFVAFEACETRDWSVNEAKAHEHFLSLAVETKSRSRALAQAIVTRIETTLDDADLALEGHRLVNLRLVFWTVAKRQGGAFGATLRFRAATEPLE